MDTAALDELRALRTRAYGPSADIHDDAEALRRLGELEALNGRRVAPPEDPIATPPPAAPPVDPEASDRFASAVGHEPEAPAPAPAERAHTPAAPAAEPEAQEAARALSALAAPAPDEPGPPGRRIPRAMALLWAASVVGAAALAAGATYAVTEITPVSVSSGAPQVASLDPVSTAALPVGWFGAGPSSLVFEYLGLTIFQTDGYSMVGSDCFTVVRTADIPPPDEFDQNSWSYNGGVYSGCGIGAFPATIEMPIDSQSPTQLTDRFPVGGALQFVFDGERIGVFADLD
ncbi:hypothetical protein AB1K54_11425 [Microbacterium sp. BWT-B31]|uniref:hypothetical protein n=1 Tax=Microbacterium sp. BWT-B31 TaxID=3232072 RepID=UPI003529B599